MQSICHPCPYFAQGSVFPLTSPEALGQSVGGAGILTPLPLSPSLAPLPCVLCLRHNKSVEREAEMMAPLAAWFSCSNWQTRLITSIRRGKGGERDGNMTKRRRERQRERETDGQTPLHWRVDWHIRLARAHTVNSTHVHILIVIARREKSEINRLMSSLCCYRCDPTENSSTWQVAMIFIFI